MKVKKEKCKCGRELLPNLRYCEKCRKYHLERAAEYRENNREKIRQYQKNYHNKLKEAAFNAYGGPECSCCGETNVEFLTIDHIDGGGTKHMKKIKVTLYRWLKQNDYPEGFRVLCMNCNLSYGQYGYCPHNKQSRVKVA